jgi:hypothetical protein
MKNKVRILISAETLRKSLSRKIRSNRISSEQFSNQIGIPFDELVQYLEHGQPLTESSLDMLFDYYCFFNLTKTCMALSNDFFSQQETDGNKVSWFEIVGPRQLKQLQEWLSEEELQIQK